jgi:beta-1,4-mannosyltransferase
VTESLRGQVRTALAPRAHRLVAEQDQFRLLAASMTNAPNANAFPSLWTQAVRGVGVEVQPFSAGRAASGSFDAVHVHWPDELFGRIGRDPRRLARRFVNLASVALAKLRGTTIFWTVHNLEPHDTSKDFASRWMLRAFEALVDEFWVLSHSTESQVRQRHRSEIAVRNMKHPAYPVIDQPDVEAEPGRVVSFGEVRAYRGYVELCEAFADVSRDWTLEIAGKGRQDPYGRTLASLVQGSPKVTWRDERLSDEQLVSTVLRSEVVVLLYQRVTNSGAALMALTLHRPVIVPDTEVFRELRSEVGADWVHLYSGDLEADLRSASMPKAAPPRLDDRTWDKLGAVVHDAIRENARRGRRTSRWNVLPRPLSHLRIPEEHQ